jgi:hypothetical protein
VRKVGPDAMIEELTSLPKRYTPEEMKAAADRDFCPGERDVGFDEHILHKLFLESVMLQIGNCGD